MKKLIILDFDGTLGNSEPLITRTMMQVIDALRLEKRTRRQCAAMIGLPLRQTFTQLIPMSDEMGRRCEETYRELFAKNNVRGAVEPFPHVAETLRRLHAHGHTLTIASSRYRQSLMDYVEAFGWTDIISYVLGADDVSAAKPDPEPVLRTLRDMGRTPGEALVVGDTRYDILMGRNAGVATCGVTYGNGTREELRLAGADCIIDDFADLPV